MSKEQAEKALGLTVTAVHDADSLDESRESPELLAREAARGILIEYDEEPEEVMETADGFVVTSGSHAIFMGHDGSFDLTDLPGETTSDDDDDTDTSEDDTTEDDETPAKYVLVQKETGVAVGPVQELTMEEAAEKTKAFEEQGTPLYYVPEAEVENGKLKPKVTLDELQVQVESLLADADPTDEKLMPLLRTFDEAKEAGDHYAAVEAAKAIAEAAGKEFIPTPAVPPMPKKPVDVGPGPGKSTGAGGGGSPKVGIPTSPAPTPKKPVSTGPGPGKSTGESEEGVVQFTFPAARIEEFIKIAEKAGAGDDAKVVVEGDNYTVTLSEEVGLAVRPFFQGDGVTCEILNETTVGSEKGGGSGWGPFKKGKKITSLAQVKKGMLILVHSKRFKAKNVLRVLSVNRKRGLFDGRYVDPAKPKTKRLGSDQPFSRWEDDLKNAQEGAYYEAKK